MKLDYKSFQEKYGEVKKHLSKEVIDAVEGTLPVWDMYDDPEFKPSIDDVIDLVNGEIADLKDGSFNDENGKTANQSNSINPEFKPAILTENLHTRGTFNEEMLYQRIVDGNKFVSLDLKKGDEIFVIEPNYGYGMAVCCSEVVVSSDGKKSLCYFKMNANGFEYKSEKEREEAKANKKTANKSKKEFTIRCYAMIDGDWSEEEDYDNPHMRFGSQSDAVKEAKAIISNHKGMEYKVDVVDYEDQDNVVKTFTSKPAKQKKEKKAKQQKPKFKVGDYVKWFDGAFNHVGIIVKGRTEDDNVYYTDGYEIRHESDGRKCIGVSESFLSKASKKEYDKAEKAYIESKKEPVASFPLEYSLLKRYIWLNDKKMSVARAHKSNNPEAILRAIQNAIGQKKIRKESKYANEIMTAQKQLIKLLRSHDRKEITGSTIIGIDGYEACKAVIDSMRVDDISKISTNFISKVQEKENRKTEAQNILAKLNELNETGDNKDLVASMKKSIQDYIDGKTDKVESIERQLRGVLGSIQKRGMRGLGSLVGDIPSEDNTISSEQLLKAKFETLQFTGRWESFFGEPSRNFKAMIYGRAGSGKSTFAIQFAKYLSKDLGLKLLYIASEEKFGHTLQEKVRRFNVANDNIAFADKLPLDITKYDVVFFDSVNDMKIEPAELMEMTANIASVGIFQCTKTGTFRGGEDFAHDVDIVVEVEDMVASTTKNRFQAGSMQFSVR